MRKILNGDQKLLLPCLTPLVQWKTLWKTLLQSQNKSVHCYFHSIIAESFESLEKLTSILWSTVYLKLCISFLVKVIFNLQDRSEVTVSIPPSVGCWKSTAWDNQSKHQNIHSFCKRDRCHCYWIIPSQNMLMPHFLNGWFRGQWPKVVCWRIGA